MIWVIIWAVFCIFYLIASVVDGVSAGYSLTDGIKTAAGAIGLFSSFVIALYQNNLTFYFYWMRLINRIRNLPAKWKLNIRLDGEFSPEVVNDLSKYLISAKTKQNFSAKTYHKTRNSINFSINETLIFYLDFQPQAFESVGYDCIDIAIAPFEIGSNDSRKKLKNEIIPILDQLQEFLRPQNVSYVLNVTFLKSNPFYAVYISHLKPSQVANFTVNLHIDSYSKGKAKDIVTINKENVVVNANSLHSLRELSEDFICLSPNVKQLVRG